MKRRKGALLPSINLPWIYFSGKIAEEVLATSDTLSYKEALQWTRKEEKEEEEEEEGAININLHFRSLLPSLSQTTDGKTRAVSFKIV